MDEEFGEGKYAGTDTEDTYQIVLEGLDYGVFTFEINETQGDEVINESIITDVPVQPGSIIAFTISALENISSLSYDIEGDGEIDFILNNDEEIEALVQLSILQKIIDDMNIDGKVKKKLNKTIQQVVKAIDKEKVEKANRKLDKLVKVINSKTGKNFSEDDASKLLEIVKYVKI